jgi:hypothetical protein
MSALFFFLGGIVGIGIRVVERDCGKGPWTGMEGERHEKKGCELILVAMHLSYRAPLMQRALSNNYRVLSDR